MNENPPVKPIGPAPSVRWRAGAAARAQAERAELAALVRRLRGAGASPEVLGAPVVPSPGAVLTAHALGGLLALALALPRPLGGLALLIACCWSALHEVEGREGWVSRFVPRTVGHSVILWGDRPLQGRERPCLLIAAPMDGTRPARPVSRGLLAALAAPAAPALVGLLLAGLMPGAARDLHLIGAVGLGLVLLVGLIAHRWRRWRGEPSPEPELLLRLHEGLRAAPPQHLDVVLALSTGLAARGDALATLIVNHRHRLPAGATRVLALTPLEEGAEGGAEAVAVAEDGRWRPRPADRLCLEAARAVGLPTAARVTASSRVMAAGWRSLSLGLSPKLPAEPILATVAALDRAAGEGRW